MRFYKFKAQEMIDKYLDRLNASIPESMENVNAIIVNTYFTFGDARPTPPGIIEVGGCTYKTPKPLPKVSTINVYISKNETYEQSRQTDFTFGSVKVLRKTR